ncbi:MAG: two-component sensor histidine kinase, partial [Deltaproteobacteria bacterium]
MINFTWYRNLSVKLIFWVGVITILAIGAFAWVNLRTQRRHMMDEVISGAQQLSDTIKRSLWYDMLHNYRDALYNVIEAIGKQEGIEKVRIFNKEGMIMFSSDKEEIGRMVDKRAEACYGCHAVDKPLERLDIPKRTRIFQADGYRVLGMTSPIYNEPACWEAPCHAHPPEQKVLGVLDVSLSLATADKRIEEIKRKTLLFAVMTILAISTIIGLFIRRAVYRPVKELVKGTRRVAQGDFEHAIPFRSKDELGQLAESFNKMTQRLKRAQYQLLQSEKLASIGKLAATIAHEINNPLNGILTYTKLIERKLAQDSVKREELERFRSYLSIMERETERCSNIVRNLLDFARQREPSLKSDVDVNGVLE